MFKRKGKPETDAENKGAKFEKTPDGDGTQTHDVDVNAWKQDFNFPPEELAERGDPVGFIRFVAFEKDDKLQMLSDVYGSNEFAQAFIETLVKNDETFDYLKQLVDRADRMRKIRDLDFSDIFAAMSGRRRGPSFPPGGMSFGDADELAELFGIKERKSPLDAISDFMEGRKRRGPGIEVHVVGLGGKPGEGSGIGALLDALRKDGPAGMAALARKMSGGKGCDCSECRAEQERVAKAKSETEGAGDKREDDPERNGTE